MTKEKKLEKAKEKKIQNPLNFILKSGKKVSGPSMTIPDQSMSMRELLHRFSQGSPINATIREPIWVGEDGEGIDMRTLDLAERQELIKAAEVEMNEIKLRIKAAKEEQQKAKIAKIEKEAEQRRLNKEAEAVEIKEIE